MTKTTEPLISVIMPIYNSAYYLRQTLDCVCYNSYKNLEIICVLDAPVDGSDKIAEDYAKSDSRITIIRQPRNMGQSVARNIGLKHATGEWVHFMDSDDLISADFYKNMLAAREYGDFDGIMCSEILHEAAKTKMTFMAPTILSNFGDILDMMAGMAVAPWAWLLPRKFLNDIGFYFPEDMRASEDYIAMSKAIDNMNRVCVAKDTFYIYKNRSTSVSKNRSNKRLVAEETTGKKVMSEFAMKSGSIQRHDIFKAYEYFGKNLVIVYCIDGSKEIILFRIIKILLNRKKNEKPLQNG
jgi:glycosyltransferase involved in cell wall biosynthesis